MPPWFLLNDNSTISDNKGIFSVLNHWADEIAELSRLAVGTSVQSSDAWRLRRSHVMKVCHVPNTCTNKAGRPRTVPPA